MVMWEEQSIEMIAVGWEIRLRQEKKEEGRRKHLNGRSYS